ncbi:hypothetical protein [Euryhalocaulis caribicus]|uniref:hypothetical protein n=1 Tax=Euryhalocaulis caribicus TaxID=1161401 RepID=UPI00039DD65D|nr:hypothetical protein [Euryhalocaulis caribicus]
MSLRAVIILLALAAWGCASDTGEKRVARDYPAAAAPQGVTAICDLVFDVRANGSTENICAACSTTAPANPAMKAAFERSAKRTLKGWKYSAPDGARKDVGTQLTYGMATDSGEPLPLPEPPSNKTCRPSQTTEN